MSGIGRNGTSTANLRFFCNIYFRDYSRTAIENFRSKFAREPTYFQEFLETKKESTTSINFIRALALLRYLEHTAASIHFVYQIRAPAATGTLETRCHNALQQAIDFQFSTLCCGEICHASKHFDGQLVLLGSLLSRTERREISNAFFSK